MPHADLNPDELRRRTILSGVVALAVRSAQAVLSLGAAIVLARLLSPADFGIFAMVVPLGVVATGIAAHGLQTTLLQRASLSDQDASTFFWMALRDNLGVAALMLAGGFALSWFYGEPRVIGVTAVWSALVGGLTLTSFQEALLKRQIRFPRVSVLQLVSLLLGIVAAVTAARRGAGYWALPLQLFVTEITRAIGIFLISGWRPGTSSPSARANAVEMQRSWRTLRGLALATWVAEQPDLVAVGRVGGAAGLGYYDVARRWSWYAFEEPFMALSDLAVASFSRVRTDEERFRSASSRGILTMLSVSMPLIAFAGAESASLVEVLLGRKWLPAVPYMQLLCIVSFVGALRRVSQWIPLASGHASRLLRWSLYVRTPTMVGAALLGLTRGTLGVAIAMVAAAVVLVLPEIYYTIRGSGVGFAGVLRAAARPSIASILAASTLLTVSSFIPLAPSVLYLTLAAGIFAMAFCTAWLMIPGGVSQARELANALGEAKRAPTGSPGFLG